MQTHGTAVLKPGGSPLLKESQDQGLLSHGIAVQKQLVCTRSEIARSGYLFSDRETFFATASTLPLTVPPGGSP